MPVVRGDINGDSRVTVIDVLKLNRIILGHDPEPPPGTDAFDAADANDDDAINVADIVKQINIIGAG